MASTEVLPLAPLTEDDLDGCVALSAEAGWNQTPADWALFMRHGTVFGLPGADGRPVATGAILRYAQEFAWISMVLVTASRRRERIGTRVLEACCAELVQRRLVAVLDATPAGERVYRPLGFEPMFPLSRWQGQGGAPGPGPGEVPDGIRLMTAADLATIAAADAVAFGSRRTFLLENLYQRAPRLAFVTQNGDGFVLARPGRVATQIGPVVAPHEQAGAALLRAALRVTSGLVFLDVADRWSGLAAQLRQDGFTVQRPFLRMGLERCVAFGDVAHTFVVAGPEFG